MVRETVRGGDWVLQSRHNLCFPLSGDLHRALCGENQYNTFAKAVEAHGPRAIQLDDDASKESLEGDNRTVIKGRFVGVKNDFDNCAPRPVLYVQVGRDITRHHGLHAHRELDRSWKVPPVSIIHRLNCVVLGYSAHAKTTIGS